MNCTAVVVSYNSSADLPACVRSLLDQRELTLDIVVIDNASRDGSADLVRDRFPQVRLTANAANVGFAQANNQVFETVPAPYFALVNPDTVLPPDAIVRCLAYLEEHSSVGIVGTPLIDVEGKLYPSRQRFLGLRKLFRETFFLDRLFPDSGAHAPPNAAQGAPDRPTEVDWLGGAFLVARGEMIRSVGGFDPDFFMYAEEMDWCFRARRAGWKVVYLPGPEVVHVGGSSSRPIAGPMFVENLKGRLRFLHKHRGPAVTLAARILTAASVVLRWGGSEAAALVTRASGRPVSEFLAYRLAIFRAARGWVARGLPLSPPDLEGARPRSG